MTDPGNWIGASVTYDEIGATRGTLPSDAHVSRAERVVGRGKSDFRTIGDAILRYEMHRGAGLTVRASTASARVGTVMICSAWFLGHIRIPCRVVYVDEPEPERVGFAYGTLPGHPESGEGIARGGTTSRRLCRGEDLPRMTTDMASPRVTKSSGSVRAMSLRGVCDDVYQERFAARHWSQAAK